MNKPQILPNLFDLTKEDEDTSKMMYDGKIIKCLVSPYHTYNDLEKIVPFTKTTYLFPEREVGIDKLKGLISSIVASPAQEEFRIITTNQNIIQDMVDGCVRVLTQPGDIVRSPIKTFLANIHDIRYSLLENELHQLSSKEKQAANDRVNAIIKKLNGPKSLTAKEIVSMEKEIKLIGEPIIRTKLLEMLSAKS